MRFSIELDDEFIAREIKAMLDEKDVAYLLYDEEGWDDGIEDEFPFER